ncbi:MAG TPA: hypothetical protein PKY82_35790, partial [Pyrinomonadaceae bacterium]|nr:hypothetical protein [Pyrinomonadaceae bacterium]
MKFIAKRKLKILALFISLVLLGFIAFDVSSASGNDPIVEDESEDLYFPPAPEIARIKFLKSLSSPKDWKLKQSSVLMRFFNKVIGFDDRENRIIFPYGVTTDSQNRL